MPCGGAGGAGSTTAFPLTFEEIASKMNVVVVVVVTAAASV